MVVLLNLRSVRLSARTPWGCTGIHTRHPNRSEIIPFHCTSPLDPAEVQRLSYTGGNRTRTYIVKVIYVMRS